MHIFFESWDEKAQKSGENAELVTCINDTWIYTDGEGEEEREAQWIMGIPWQSRQTWTGPNYKLDQKVKFEAYS